ncbi:hypothetical protein MOQ72_10320 [Saccharopolyspora sp. K220]|uniref:hypothetical protein n=1 Tax=Saccharopolyspora soli TaxID=2926618 RepID=UPI001F58B18E|nr:hypothetical protein [Saccharopolyspora soli]MCI2417819.1 hypothetical protein [Saccharopolyspora soli]
MAKGTSQRWRQAVVWLHVITSVGWMAQALVLFTLLAVSATSNDPEVRISATSMAHVVDVRLLAPFANAAAFTGLMLAAATAWGFFRNWWVLVKFAITIVQLYAGIFILSGALENSVATAEAGLPTPPLSQLVGTSLMASAIAFQAWLSVAKPWRRTPWAGKRKLPTAPNRVFVAAVIAPLIDIATGIVLGFPSPLCQLIVLTTALITRHRRIHRQQGKTRSVTAEQHAELA